jgi:hypothetical protein
MRSIKTIFTLIFIVVILISCYTNDELIIGKWKIDYSKYNKNINKLNEYQLQEYNKTVTLLESTTFEFFKNKTFEISSIKDGEKITKSGKYQILDNGRYLELTTKPGNEGEKVQKDEVIEITLESMKLLVKKDTILYRKIKEQ